MNTHLSTVLCPLAAVIVAFTFDSRAALYGPAADFYLSSNPNGVWSYGYSTNLGGTVFLHHATDLNWRDTGVQARLTTDGNGLGLYGCI